MESESTTNSGNTIHKASRNQSVSHKLVKKSKETASFDNARNISSRNSLSLLEKETLDEKNSHKESEKSLVGIKNLLKQNEIWSTKHEVVVNKNQENLQISKEATSDVDRANVTPSEKLEIENSTVDHNPVFVSLSVCAFNQLNCNYRIIYVYHV